MSMTLHVFVLLFSSYLLSTVEQPPRNVLPLYLVLVLYAPPTLVRHVAAHQNSYEILIDSNSNFIHEYVSKHINSSGVIFCRSQSFKCQSSHLCRCKSHEVTTISISTTFALNFCMILLMFSKCPYITVERENTKSVVDFDTRTHQV